MFSYRLKELRNKKSGLTQAKLAEVMNVSQQAVGLWERGKNMPSHELVAKLANFFNVSVDYLLGRTDEPQGTGFQKGLLGDINGDSQKDEKTANTGGSTILMRAQSELSPEELAQIEHMAKFFLDQKAAKNDQ